MTAIFASNAGLRNPWQATYGPMPTRVVASASAVTIVQHSQKPIRSPPISRWRWSGAQSVSTPIASASRASARISGHVA